MGPPDRDARGDRLPAVPDAREFRPEWREVDRDPAIHAELREQIAHAFYSLPASLRIVAQLALVDQTPYQEIADALDISLSAVKMRVSRAVGLLRKHLDRRGVRA